MDYQVKGRCPDCESEPISINPQEGTQSKIRPSTAGLVQACMDSGSGYAGFKKIVRGANLDATISNARYDAYSKEMSNAMYNMYEDQIKMINRAVRKQYIEEGFLPDEEGILDVAVSFDGTWQT